MLNVYISGALTGLVNLEEVKVFYEAIGRLCKEVGLEPYVPHIASDPISHHSLSPSAVFHLDKTQVCKSDLVIAYVGIPSLGVGMELAYAEQRGIPIILLYEKNRTVSRFPKGIPTLIGEITYDYSDEALTYLRDVLEDFVETQTAARSMEVATEELHITFSTPPNSQAVLTVQDATGTIIREVGFPQYSSEAVIKQFSQLREHGINPKRIFVEPFPSIFLELRAVWADAEVLLESTA